MDIFVQENLKNSLIENAQRNKYELQDTSNSYFKGLTSVPTSHFTILPENEQYLESLEFNGFVHKINIVAGKGRERDTYKNQNRLLYCFDRGVCIDEKLDCGKPESKDTKFFQQRAFEYDDVILITLKDNKKLVCTTCNMNYPIEELDMFKAFNMKCKDSACVGYCSVEFNRELRQMASEKLSHAILSESEFEVIHAIMFLLRSMPEDIITANLISREIDYSSFIAWRCRKLEESGFIKRERFNDNDPFIYSLTERATNLMGEILSK